MGVRQPGTDSFCVGLADHYMSEYAGPVDFGGALRSIRLVQLYPREPVF